MLGLSRPAPARARPRHLRPLPYGLALNRLDKSGIRAAAPISQSFWPIFFVSSREMYEALYDLGWKSYQNVSREPFLELF